MAKGVLRICPRGHRYYRSSACPVCPVCEAARKPAEGFLALLSAPARRALETARITELEDLARHTEQEILALHGMGPTSMPKLRRALAEAGLKFRNP